MDVRVERVIKIMKKDLKQDLPLSKAAQLVNLSPGRFWYLFKFHTGITPARYLRSLRMAEAASLLSGTFLSVKEIVALVGLKDESHFVRDFKRTYQATPTDYRNHNLRPGKTRQQ